MPHTNRKKRSSEAKSTKIAYLKRAQVEGEDGWTHVVETRKGSRLADIRAIETTKPWQSDFLSDASAITTMTYQEIQAEHDRYRQQWENSEACSQLKHILASVGERRKITNVVCLGLGSLQDWRLQSRRTSHTQLSALRTMMQVLEIESVRRVAQEPHFTDLDKKFMNSLGYDVLEHPEGFSQINGESLVYAVHCYPPLYQQISRQPKCVLFVGNDLVEYLQNTIRLQADRHEEIADLENLIKDCDVLDFPQIRYDFTDTKIYCRQCSSVEWTR
ncbi:MAG: hypothetical protein M1818_007722 [Claussenomyces sp. TS43310]|nr:MAG: hypothetical protein M1818_007722 [Claussenomyces sp. TS43310]